MTRLVTLNSHEFDAHWNFIYSPDNSETDDRLRPFWAFEHVIRECDGSKRVVVEHAGREIVGKLYFQESGIESLNHPSEDVETIREYRIAWHWRDDPERDNPFSGNFHIRPRHPKAVDSDGIRIGADWPDFTGVNVRVQGSNLDFREYLPLFRKLVTKLGISRRYWRDKWLDDSSNIRDAERYVRLDGQESGPIHAVNGPIPRIANLLSDDRSGYRKHVADDRGTEGHYHTATIGADRARELIQLHNLPKEIKHYYGKHPESVDDDHPIAYPKLGASYQASLDSETLYWDQLDRLYRELDEVVLNVLRWAGLSVAAEDIEDDLDTGARYTADEQDTDDSEGLYHRLDDAPGPYVDDAYHRVEFRHRQLRLVEDPLPEIEADQESVVIRALSDGLEESDFDVLETLVTDGGDVAPADVADDHDWHLETIYAAVDRLDEVVEHSYGELSLRSHHVARRVVEAVEAAQEAGKNAIETAAKALAGADRFEQASDTMTQWLDRHGVEIDDRDDGRLVLRAGEWSDRDTLQAELRRFVDAWSRSGFERDRLLEARIEYRAEGYPQIGLVDSEIG